MGARGFTNQTVRMIVRTSIGGRRLRVRLANAFGSAPVAVGAAHIAIRAKESDIAPGTDRALAFNGKPACAIGPGMVILSDPVDLTFAAARRSCRQPLLPRRNGPPTSHATGLHTTYISKEGDVTGQAAMADAATTQSYYWLAGVDVLAPADAALIVALRRLHHRRRPLHARDNHSWPALLAARSQATRRRPHFAVANMGIGGNRVLRDGTGSSALARFDRDVLSQAGVKWVMLLEGINDIGRRPPSRRKRSPPTISSAPTSRSSSAPTPTASR